MVYPEKQLAKWTAIRFTSNHILDYIALDNDHAIVELDLPDAWAGKTVGKIDIRRKYGINILGVKRSGKLHLTVTPDTQFLEGDTVLVLGENRALQKAFRI